MYFDALLVLFIAYLFDIVGIFTLLFSLKYSFLYLLWRWVSVHTFLLCVFFMQEFVSPSILVDSFSQYNI